MNNVFTIVLAVCLALSMTVSCNAVPASRLQDVPHDASLVPIAEFSYDEPDDPDQGVRFPRVTCDLLSVSTTFGSLNHAACAAHCLAMMRGYRGGRCRDGVCHCRR